MNRSNRPSLPVVEERREFLQTCASALLGLTFVGVVSPLVTGCEPSGLPTPPTIPGNGGTGSPEGTTFDVSVLDSDGKAVATDITGSDGYAIMITRRAGGVYAALSMRCTHESCPVDARLTPTGLINCSCHGSQFDLDGSVRRSPATSPLKSYETTFDAATKTVRIKVT